MSECAPGRLGARSVEFPNELSPGAAWARLRDTKATSLGTILWMTSCDA